MKEIHHIIIVGKTIIIKTSFLILPIHLMLYQNNNETLLRGEPDSKHYQKNQLSHIVRKILKNWSEAGICLTR